MITVMQRIISIVLIHLYRLYRKVLFFAVIFTLIVTGRLIVHSTLHNMYNSQHMILWQRANALTEKLCYTYSMIKCFICCLRQTNQVHSDCHHHYHYHHYYHYHYHYQYHYHYHYITIHHTIPHQVTSHQS